MQLKRLKLLKRLKQFILLCSFLSLCGAAPKEAAKAGPPRRARAAPVGKGSAAQEPGVPLDAKVILYSERDVVRIHTKLRYTTLIVLPKNEQILDISCGDKDFWVINGNQNFAYVKPAKAGAQTNATCLRPLAWSAPSELELPS